MITNRQILIVGITSDIGSLLAEQLLKSSNRVFGTSRSIGLGNKRSDNIFYLDLSDKSSIDNFITHLPETFYWDELIFCPATLEPIGSFADISIEQWIDSFNLNFTNQVYLLKKLLDLSSQNHSHVLFFSGGGINSAPPHHSNYILSKIAIIKLVELLDFEYKNISFTTIGPGWVKTKIHLESLKIKYKSLPCYKETQTHYKENEFTKMEKVLDSIIWILTQPKEVIGGRDISTNHDDWSNPDFIKILQNNSNVCKLRKTSYQ